MSVEPKDYIIEIVKEIYEAHNICELGFDIIKLCENMGYTVIPYSSLSQKQQEAYMAFDPDGFSAYNEKKQRCEIYYNDKICPKTRIIFTISHELGHIELGHIFQEESTSDMEQDAIEFARQLYAPQVILYHKEINTPEKIESVFKVGPRFACVLYERLQDRLFYCGHNFSDIEMSLWNSFILAETIKQL